MKVAVLENVAIRPHPIMMSAIKILFGMSPLVFNRGAGTELSRIRRHRAPWVVVLNARYLHFHARLLSLILELEYGVKTGREASMAVS